MSAVVITEKLKAEARRLGFGLVGACPAVQPGGFHRFLEWLDAGYAGQMAYLSQRREAHRHPSSVLPGVRSLLMLGMHYRTAAPVAAAPGEGRIARYAWGEADYHDLIHKRLKTLRTFLLGLQPTANARGVVDTAPLLERDFAQLAGLGWKGKNTLLLNKNAGSYFFLAALLTDLELAYDTPHEADHCGTCRACLDACPTDAFPQPYVLDATRCISYQTIELRGAAPAEFREATGDWLFGCDICQEVCPWNSKAPPSAEPELAPLADLNPIDAASLFALSEDDFRQRFRRSPLWRPRRAGLLCNAAVVLGNRRPDEALPALRRGLADQEPTVRAACAWALGRYDSAEARAALAARRKIEQDQGVQQELAAALAS